jgi:hypothetical protein
MEKVQLVTEDYSPALRSMRVGDVLTFPVKSISTINSLLSRLRLEMCVEGADWKRIGDIDKRKGIFRVKRVA